MVQANSARHFGAVAALCALVATSSDAFAHRTYNASGYGDTSDPLFTLSGQDGRSA